MSHSVLPATGRAWIRSWEIGWAIRLTAEPRGIHLEHNQDGEIVERSPWDQASSSSGLEDERSRQDLVRSGKNVLDWLLKCRRS